ncbi:MAG TPA: hypothetical protein VHB97_26360 [Polyangia bacterium]|jgi:hypothetical protein|nr:hypothetical protein [Polyangia bacterium]
MTKVTKVSSRGALVAMAAAGLFAGCAGSQAGKTTMVPTAAVQCSGINSCKGQGSCKGNENACKAKNDCKGKGWVETASADECTSKGGKVL